MEELGKTKITIEKNIKKKKEKGDQSTSNLKMAAKVYSVIICIEAIHNNYSSL